MKRFVIAALLLITAGSSFAQTKMVVIGQGSTLDYTVHAPNGDVIVSTVLSKVSDEEVRFDWLMHQLAGTFRVQRASLDSARHGYWNPPVDGEDVILDPSQSLLQLSKACWKDIQLNKPMVFGSTRYHVIKKFDRYEVGGIAIDCLYLESTDKQSGLWIANNEKLPMILKIGGNPDGVSVELVAVR
jgi:hypothetical protein